MMVMVKMVKIEMEKKEKCSIIYNIYRKEGKVFYNI